ncbi:MAG: TIGR04282 family arsenosugar biosynthesis glycosyltransferase [Peptoniphilus sp.]|uniref:TIGR04282 family arsenosugar biosynthesis glycosyltransferase n=1 Tax=Peptoniphilus sp. TaxID=1971214 RepID=UPI002A74E33B|nr:TIGR04282 family arsenosugar biosynthesis glycosyltransferase [Peptoniphilus sp.]MDY2986175.1 TIGR04282 family arsenosugar biosynthesis glycosyltransferase [Peptoniphilus sp.]
MKRKIIFFTKAPALNYGKSRLKNFLSAKDRYELSVFLIKDNLKVLEKSGYEFVVYFSGDIENLNFIDYEKIPQRGENLGDRMFNALKAELNSNDQVILLGSDLRGITLKLIESAFSGLNNSDCVIAPAEDGGYGLIGLRKPLDLFSNIVYSQSDVFEKTLQKATALDISIERLDTVRDIDEIIDLIKEELQTKDVEILGSGEYNLNYRFNKNFVCRINLGSQLHLGDEQITYEYNALKTLESSGVTPKPHYLKKNSTYIRKGFLVMDYLVGRPLNYDTDMSIAAYLLSRVHNLEFKDTDLIRVEQPFKAMFEECFEMYSVYKNSKIYNNSIGKYVEHFFDYVKELDIQDNISNPCIINTELNNRNFIINGDNSYIIDWEKPLIGEAEQDLAHFLVPTTTNWKTDKILSDSEIEKFIYKYEKYRKINRQKLKKYFAFNVLRGITWCSMAKVEYEASERILSNQDTYEKINKFLSEDYLKMLHKRFYEV